MADRIGALGGEIGVALGAGARHEGRRPHSGAPPPPTSRPRAPPFRWGTRCPSSAPSVWSPAPSCATGWRGLVALGLLFGLVGGIVLGTVAVADRTVTAYERLAAATGLADAQVLLPAAHETVFDQVPSMPGVTASWTPVAWIAQINTPAVRFVSLSGGPGHPAGLAEPVVVAGRAPRDNAANEILVSEPTAADLDLHVGDEVILRLLLAQEIARFSQGFGQPDGGFARVTVVGIARAPAWADPVTDLIVTPAFARKHAADVSARGVFVRLASTAPAARDAFAAALADAYAADPDTSPLDALLRPQPAFPTSGVDPTVRAAQAVLLAGLVVFGVVVGLGGLLVVAQGLLRHHGGRRHVQRIERALGMTLVERAVARVLAGGVGALAAGVAGATVALASGLIEPLGSQARYEPAPGFRAPWAVALGGGLALALMFVAMTAVAAALVAARAGPSPAPSSGHAPLGRWPAVLAGVGLAWHGPRSTGGVRTAATVAGLGLAVVGDRRGRDVPGEPAAARRHPGALRPHQRPHHRRRSRAGRRRARGGPPRRRAGRRHQRARDLRRRREAPATAVGRTPEGCAPGRDRRRAGRRSGSVRSRWDHGRRTGSGWESATPSRCARSRVRRWRYGSPGSSSTAATPTTRSARAASS